MKQKLTQDRLKELLNYDPETGVFIWKAYRNNNAKKGSIAGCLNKESGYWDITLDGKKYKAHRLVFLYIDGYLPENGIDHRDRNKINNRYDNLREASKTCNARNCKVSNANKVGITGVSWCNTRKKWKAKISIPKQLSLGYFDNLLDAAKARWNAEVKYNFPNCNTISSAYNYLKKHGAI